MIIVTESRTIDVNFTDLLTVTKIGSIQISKRVRDLYNIEEKDKIEVTFNKIIKNIDETHTILTLLDAEYSLDFEELIQRTALSRSILGRTLDTLFERKQVILRNNAYIRLYKNNI